MSKKLKLGVVIGRFQPFHYGHASLIDRAIQESDRVLIFVGSANSPRSSRNPFSYEERRNMIHSYMREREHLGVVVFPINDHLYLYEKWQAELYRIYQSHLTPGIDYQTTLFGVQKSDTGYLEVAEKFGWKLRLLDNKYPEIHASKVRHLIYDNFSANKATKLCPNSIHMHLHMEASKPREFSRLEYLNALDYLDAWKGPYAPTFNTTDVMVTVNYEYVLLIKRGEYPGKGLYAFPGGYINPGETLLNTAIRECKEETGLDINKNYLVNSKTFDYPNRDPRGRVITTGFHFNINTKVLPKVKGSDDAQSAQWVKYDRDSFFMGKIERQETACDFWDIFEWFTNSSK